jgi:hypothetical protein
MNMWQRWNKTSLPNKLAIIISAFAAVLSVVNLHLLNRQISDQDQQVGKITKAITDGIDKAKAAMNSVLVQQNAALEKILGENRTALNAATTQSKATLDGSLKQGQQALSASIEASRRDQRAWVGFPSLNVRQDVAVGRFTVSINAYNSGKTTATHSMIRIGMAEPVCTVLPADPFQIATANQVIPAPIMPNAPVSSADITIDIRAQDLAELREDNLQRLRSTAPTCTELARLYVFASIDYCDIFGNAHFRRFCGYWDRSTPRAFNVCESHTDGDEDHPGAAPRTCPAN